MARIAVRQVFAAFRLIMVLPICAGSCSAWAASPDTHALAAAAALLAASSLPIDQASSCHGVLPGIAAPTVGDVVASRLIDLSGGKNGISVRCEDGATFSACRVTIEHADGEDVSSAEFRFRLVRGRLDPGSLVCALTP